MPPNPINLPSMSLIPIIEGLQSPLELQSVLLYFLFTIHILLVNMLLGTAIFSLAERILFTHRKHDLAAVNNLSVLLPKGIALAVNFGIPPLLFLQGMYGQFIYPSSIIIAVWWISLMALVIFAYYGLYLHATSKSLSETAKTWVLALSIGVIAFIAFLLVNNVTLMSSPEQWSIYAKNSHGTYLNFTQHGIIPRYLHILFASIAIGGITIALLSTFSLAQDKKTIENRKDLPLDSTFSEKIAYKEQRKKRGLSWFVGATLCQIPIGLWFLFSLPAKEQGLFLGSDIVGTAVFLCAIILACFSLYHAIKQHTMTALLCIILTIFAMSFMRTLLRASLLEPYYTPVMRKFESSPLTFFIACTVGSIVILLWMFKLYLQKSSPKLNSTSIFMIDALAEANGDSDEEDTTLTRGLHSLYTENHDTIGNDMPEKRS